ncbi:hypothetical protein EXIGLDRAFT_312559 [Exidia glandulosa HHB12029]|uniref:Uncharacterized protein n=1 Tax=Exidia glandulosa HHB12029 TaxID=1314781 RepID=A0A165CYS8_EXIGL|nr:hypothetical protein EXIGLDRAFT_312559 [Exidia glandulosa HHB12029]
MDAGLYTTLRVLVCRLGEHLDYYLPLSSYRRWEIFERYYWQRALHVRTSWDEQLRLELSAVTVYYKNTGYQHPVASLSHPSTQRCGRQDDELSELTAASEVLRRRNRSPKASPAASKHANQGVVVVQH